MTQLSHDEFLIRALKKRINMLEGQAQRGRAAIERGYQQAAIAEQEIEVARREIERIQQQSRSKSA